MHFPTFLPSELAQYTKFKTPQEVFEALKESLDDAVFFFETGCEHESWCQHEDGHELMKLLFQWLTEQFFERKLSLIHVELIANSVHGKFKVIKDFMPLDIFFQMEQEKIPANSLMFGAASDLIREIIWREGMMKRQNVIPLQNLSLAVFEYFKEYVYTGMIEFLWREKPEGILKILRRAVQWHIAGLAEFGASIFRRYFTPENVLDYLLMAHKEVLFSLKYEACSFLNKLGYKINLIPREANELDVEVEGFTEEGEEILKRITNIVTHVTCHTDVLEDKPFYEFIKKKERLIGLNLSDTKKINENLIERFPNVRDLNLSRALWINDGIMIQIIVRTAGLIHLKLVEDAQLTFRTWGALASLPQLSTLDISECWNFDDAELDLLSTSCPQLVKLTLAGCSKITDRGLLSLARHCLSLEVLSLARCNGLTKTGLLATIALCKNLQRLDIENCDLPEDTAQAVLHISPHLKIKV